jgi:hypothetical protein
MEEIATFLQGDPGAQEMYRGIAQFYQQIADTLAAPTSGDAVAQLKEFCAERGEAKRKSA